MKASGKAGILVGLQGQCMRRPEFARIDRRFRVLPNHLRGWYFSWMDFRRVWSTCV